ncbi:MAG: dihydrolipoyl dehydrogenase, partial [Candidatus Hermodarchaeota archaeon]
GGYHSAIRAAQFGAKVALIEKDKLGGTCLNLGCIPAKALFSSTELIQKLRETGAEHGIICNFELDFAKAVERKNKVVKQLTDGIATLENGWNNDVFTGRGKLSDGNIKDGFTIAIEGDKKHSIKTKRVIIATGSTPVLIPSFNIDHDRILTSDDILAPEFKIVPKRLLIIGAGFAGCEFANIFASFGSKVTVLEYLPSAIATEEPMVVKELQKRFKELGVEIHTSQNVLSIENTGSGVKATVCSADVPIDQIKTAEKTYYETDYCLISIGRAKESRDLGLENFKIKTSRGAIKVNPKTLQTSEKGIYAIGDVTGGIMLAHVARHEGDVAVSNALASIGGFPVKKSTTDYRVVPATIFTSPNIGSVGLRRKQAKDMGYDVLFGRFPYSALGKAKCLGEERGFLLILADRATSKIIGASCIGAEASELIAEIALAMKHDLTVHQVVDTIHSHPTLSEMVLEAMEDVFGMAIHKKSRPIGLDHQ